jgi:hypothetical protein
MKKETQTIEFKQSWHEEYLNGFSDMPLRKAASWLRQPLV